MGRTPALCVGQYGFEENGIRVSCKPKRNEQVFAIQLDGCLLNDNDPKCDGAFIWQAPNRAALLLVELKGAGDIPHAFGQLAYVKNRRPEYQQLKSLITTPRPIEKAFIVSSGVISKPQKEKLEKKAMLGDAKHQILFVGYQTSGTPGRKIQKYGPSGGYVDLDGQRYTIKAGVDTITGYSAHADQKDLLNFIKRMRYWPKQVRLVHGQTEAKQALKAKIEDLYSDRQLTVDVILAENTA